MSEPIKSLPVFRRRAEAAFRSANPGAVITIEWEWSRRVTFPTGLKGFTGKLIATADGYKPSTRIASWAEGCGLMV